MSRKMKMVRVGDSYVFISDEPWATADEVAAEYLIRQVPEEPFRAVWLSLLMNAQTACHHLRRSLDLPFWAWFLS